MVKEKEKLAFLALWLLAAFLIFYATGCLSEEEAVNEEHDSTDSAHMFDYTHIGQNIDISQGEVSTPLQSYEGCSNKIEVWKEPDPLTHPCNFRLVDQHGNNVELYDFEGSVIMLDFSTMWCYWCNVAAAHTQEFHDSSESFSVLTILLEDSTSDEVDIADLQAWASSHGISSAPILAGNSDLIGTNINEWNVSGLPTFFFIDKNFYVRKLFPGWNQETVTNYISELIAEQ